MHKQDSDARGSRRNGGQRRNAGWTRAGRTSRITFLFAILLAAGSTGALAAPAEAGVAAKLPVVTAPPAVARGNATASTTTAALSTLFFDFGNNLVGNKMIQTAVEVTNTGKTALTLKPTIAGDTSFSIVTTESCGASLAAGKHCDMVLRYQPVKASYPNSQDAMLNLNFGNADAGVPGTVAITGTSAALKPGVVTATGNPQVALYTVTLPFPGEMKVNFGPTTTYGKETWVQSTDTNNSQVSIFVAGMKASTTYHMQALIVFSNGVEVKDVDHTFKTGAIAQNYIFQVTATTTAGMTPQPGIEMTNPLKALEAYDLEGNLIWTYPVPTPYYDYIDGAKMLPNGDILVAIGALSNEPLIAPITTATINEIREINLAGDTVRELSVGDLNAALQTAPSSCTECTDGGGNLLTLQTFHHDVTPLPNGHWLVLSNELRTLSKTTTPSLNSTKPVAVVGDVIIDVDENNNPVWVWNEFNHLDVNRQPMGFPDWTHTNAIIYSKDDGNILVSIRHQNWVLKVDYKNGEGNGDILWHLGEGGDFKLLGGTAPQDWQYAQHDPGFFSPNTTGVFSLGLMDNGDDRLYPAGSKCTPQGNLPASCLYSTIPVFQINEEEKTAKLTFHQKIPAADYSSFGGNTDELANGNVEYDLCGIGTSSLVREVTQDAAMKTVWSMKLSDGNFYRAWRIPSLYPGVQW
jgi:arylsulfate sulfotransferase